MTPDAKQLLTELQLETNVAKRSQIIAQLRLLDIKTTIISKAINISAPQVRHHFRVAKKLTPNVMELFEQDKISFSLARAIASLPANKQEKAAREAIAKNTSVSKFRFKLNQTSDDSLARELDRLSDEFSNLSGLDIKIVADKCNPKAGVWKIRYADLDMFDVLISKIVGHYEN